jgi:DNA adenine methylase
MSGPLFMDYDAEYREPFFGAGAIGFDVLKLLPRSCDVWLNDWDYGIVCLWNVVRNNIGPLIEKIERFTPSIDMFRLYKQEDGKKLDPIEVGFRKLALHQMSYSGLGVMSGGPLGGISQSGNYTVDCRWSKDNLIHNALECHDILNMHPKTRITHKDFSALIPCSDSRTFIYCDPPYYEKGKDLYKFSMSEQQHAKLSKMLMQTQARWALSYDDAPEIRKLYSWAMFYEITTTYTVGESRGDSRPKNKEILIVPRGQPSSFKSRNSMYLTKAANPL